MEAKERQEAKAAMEATTAEEEEPEALTAGGWVAARAGGSTGGMGMLEEPPVRRWPAGGAGASAEARVQGTRPWGPKCRSGSRAKSAPGGEHALEQKKTGSLTPKLGRMFPASSSFIKGPCSRALSRGDLRHPPQAVSAAQTAAGPDTAVATPNAQTNLMVPASSK